MMAYIESDNTDYIENKLKPILEREFVPKYLAESIVNYVSHGYPFGSFMRAVITNDLKSAVFMADDVAINHIPQIVRGLHFGAPVRCWGSQKAYQKWIEHRGLSGEVNTEENKFNPVNRNDK